MAKTTTAAQGKGNSNKATTGKGGKPAKGNKATASSNGKTKRVRVEYVMKDGVIYRPDGTPLPSCANVLLPGQVRLSFEEAKVAFLRELKSGRKNVNELKRTVLYGNYAKLCRTLREEGLITDERLDTDRMTHYVLTAKGRAQVGGGAGKGKDKRAKPAAVASNKGVSKPGPKSLSSLFRCGGR